MNDEIITYFAEQAKGTWDESEFEYLTDLDVSNKNISDIGAKAIAENLKTLVSFNLTDNPIGYEGALALIEQLPNLKYFSFDIHNLELEAQNILINRMSERNISGYYDNPEFEDSIFFEIDKNLIKFQDPYMYSYRLPKDLMNFFFAAATISLYKHNEPFPLMHSPHAAIQHEGQGRYDICVNGHVYFATPDNHDPRNDNDSYFVALSQTEIDLMCLENNASAKVRVPIKKSLTHILKKEAITHQSGHMFAYKIPDFLWKHIDHNNPFSIILVEDGIPLTTMSICHHTIIENGGGLYNVFGNQHVYFSTTDIANFNPTINGKTYALVVTERQ